MGLRLLRVRHSGDPILSTSIEYGFFEVFFKGLVVFISAWEGIDFSRGRLFPRSCDDIKPDLFVDDSVDETLKVMYVCLSFFA